MRVYLFLLLIVGECLAFPQYGGIPEGAASPPASVEEEISQIRVDPDFNSDLKRKLEKYWWKVAGIFSGSNKDIPPDIKPGLGVGGPFTPQQSKFCEIGFDCVPFELCNDGYITPYGEAVLQTRTKPANYETLKCGQEGNICCGIPAEILAAQQANVGVIDIGDNIEIQQFPVPFPEAGHSIPSNTGYNGNDNPSSAIETVEVIRVEENPEAVVPIEVTGIEGEIQNQSPVHIDTDIKTDKEGNLEVSVDVQIRPGSSLDEDPESVIGPSSGTGNESPGIAVGGYDTSLIKEVDDQLRDIESIPGYGQSPALPTTDVCGQTNYRCVPYFQCINGVINTDGAGLIDVRIRPQSVCTHPDHPDVPGVCCLVPGADPTGENLLQCPHHQICVESNLCSPAGNIITDGSGILDLRTGPKAHQKCFLASESQGICCNRPLISIETCPEKSTCVSKNECIGKALNDVNNFVEYDNTGRWTHCSSFNDGICCIQPEKIVLGTCPGNSKCVISEQCSGKVLDGSGNFAEYIADGTWSYCLLGNNGLNGICCDLPEAVVLDTCPGNSQCILADQCYGQALDLSGNFIDFASTGSYSYCSLGNVNGVCCVPPDPIVLDVCPETSQCILADQCYGQALDGSGNFIDFTSTGSYSYCSLGNVNGVCCVPPDPIILDVCPGTSQCLLADQCFGQALDGSGNFIDFASTGSYSYCSLGNVNGVCCVPQDPIILDVCPGTSQCLLVDQCFGQALDGSGNFIDFASTGSYSYCSLGNVNGICCILPDPIVLDVCPGTSQCLLADQCFGQALDGSGNFIDFASTGSYSYCSLGNINGVCCVPPDPIVPFICPKNSLCVPKDQCLDKALDSSKNFVDYISSGSWSYCSLGNANGICCLTPKPHIRNTCPENSQCVLGDQCSGQALDSNDNFIDYAPIGSWSYCSLNPENGVCCKALPSKIIEECPLQSACLKPEQCFGKALDGSNTFVSYSIDGTWTNCPKYEGGVCCQNPTIPEFMKPASSCGIRNYNIDERITSNNAANEASFGEFPWQAIIFYQNFTFVCGATLVSNKFLVTAAHCVDQIQPGDIRVRLGDWQVNAAEEILPYVDRNVYKIHIHPEFNPKNVHKDLAVLEIFNPVEFSYHINSVCLPSQGAIMKPYSQCIATGWGKDSFEGSFQSKLKKIDLPYIDRDSCQNLLRKTRLGKYFRLDTSFVCAGGEENKDACYGDGGGPLVCKNEATSRYQLIGITSWGIGCGQKNIPGVYANIPEYSTWIKNIIQANAENLPAAYQDTVETVVGLEPITTQQEKQQIPPKPDHQHVEQVAQKLEQIPEIEIVEQQKQETPSVSIPEVEPVPGYGR